MAKIYAPNKEYTGLSAGVLFENGEGQTESRHLLDWFREHGYEVWEEPEQESEKEKEKETEPAKKRRR